MLEKKEIIELIDKLLEAEGTDSEQEEWVDLIRKSVPFYEKIYNLIFWSDEDLSAEEIYDKAKQEHNPIVL